jgi:hypothetical protein
MFDLPEQESAESSARATPNTFSYEGNQGSYLESISLNTAAISGQGFTSYLSELSTAAPFDIPVQESGTPIGISERIRVTSKTPVSDIITKNSARPRRIRVYVDASVNVNKSQ